MDEVKKIAEELKQEQVNVIDSIVNINGPRTYDNTILQFIRKNYYIDRASFPLTFL